MNDDNEKPKKNKKLPVAKKSLKQMANDVEELLAWMESPRVHWPNFPITIPVRKGSEIKWFTLTVEEA
tara:strand:+ start:696 stop:899 length:204 start_codon:yes stop_codon:yes gene_type:complete